MRTWGDLLVWSAAAVLAQAGLVYAQRAVAPSAATAAAACAPSDGTAPPASEGLRIVGAQDTIPRFLYGDGDLVVVNAGTRAGVQLNQEYYIRRPYSFGRPTRSIGGRSTIHTSGRLRIAAVNDNTAIGQIQATCDGVMAGDYLEPYEEPPLIASGEPGTPATLDFSSLGRVRFGDEERRLGAAGDFMLVDPGGAQLAPGVRVAVYRDLGLSGVPLVPVGEGVIVSLENGTPVMRISSSTDAVQSGDYVVRHK